jgi:tRNA(adenine34) deaminase
VHSAVAAEIEPRDLDAVFMRQALGLAVRAAACGEVPIGALVVRGTTVLGAAHNAPIARADPTAHAEILAIRRAAQGDGNYRLPGTTLFVTVEPCLMCVGALIHARVARVVFGCWEPKAGALGSVYSVGADSRGNHRLEVRGGLYAPQARDLLQEFFRARRGA